MQSEALFALLSDVESPRETAVSRPRVCWFPPSLGRFCPEKEPQRSRSSCRQRESLLSRPRLPAFRLNGRTEDLVGLLTLVVVFRFLAARFLVRSRGSLLFVPT